MSNNYTVIIPIGDLASSKLNPRTHFDDTHIENLANSLRRDGLLENLIVRPRWCAGITDRKILLTPPASPRAGYEIVSGECRYRAAKKAGLTELACRVRVLTDPELEEINLTEQMHRNQLTPVEEAKSFNRLLGYKNSDGTARHTADSLAETLSVHRTVIYNRLQLLKLPARAIKAVSEGKLPMTIAQNIARIPDAAMQKEATKSILSGGADGDTMTKREAEAYIAEHCMKQLKGAPFDQSDATLLFRHGPAFDAFVPNGSCEGCPHRTGNNKERFGDVKRGDICTQPPCFEAKVAANFVAASADAVRKGFTILDAPSSEKVYPQFMLVGEMAFDSPYAPIDAVPASHLLKSVVKDPPTYRELVEKFEKAGMKPPVYLARNQAGRPVEVVKIENIIAGAEKAGEPIFAEKSGAPKPTSPEDAKLKAENKRLAAEASQNHEVLLAAMKELHLKMADCDLFGAWELLLKIQLEGDLEKRAPWRLVSKLLGLKKSTTAALKTHIHKLPPAEQIALLPLVLIGDSLLEFGMESPALKKFAKHFSVGLKALEKEVRARKAKKKTTPAKAKKPATTVKAKAPAKKKAPARTITASKGGAK